MTIATISRIPSRLFIGESSNHLVMNLVAPIIAPLRPLAEGERALGAFILPPFQRPSVWTETQQVRLIESLYMGMPIGALVVNSTSYGQDCDGWLLDGQQRLTTVLAYVASRFAVRGLYWNDLTERETRQFLRISLAVVQTGISDAGICREVYERLVYGGTPHAPV